MVRDLKQLEREENKKILGNKVYSQVSKQDSEELDKFAEIIREYQKLSLKEEKQDS